MPPPQEEMESRMENFKAVFREAGVKITHQRMEIYREVARTGEHPDAERIWKNVRKRMPTVSLDTVYRTLWLLKDLGLVVTMGSTKARARFDANLNHHHHFVCVKCGRMKDFYSERLDRIDLPDAVKSIGHVETMTVEVKGVCRNCMAAETESS